MSNTLELRDIHVEYGSRIAVSGISLDVEAGFGSSPEDVPEPLRLAIKMLVARWFENRGDIVGEQTLLVVDFGVESMRLSCPHGTETNMPYAQARKRYEDYVRALDDKFFSDLNGGN